jgi:hypothetical protein
MKENDMKENDIGERDDNDADDRALYWIAVRGPAVPHWPIPVPISVAREATVQVSKASMPTLWGFGGVEIPGGSNYKALIGFETVEEQQKAVATLLYAPLKHARAEHRRYLRQQPVILGPGR